MEKTTKVIKLSSLLFPGKFPCGYVGHEDRQAEYVFPPRRVGYSDAYRCEECVQKWRACQSPEEKDKFSVNIQDLSDLQRRKRDSAKSSAKHYSANKQQLLTKKKVERDLLKSLHDPRSDVYSQKTTKEKRAEALRENRRRWGIANRDKRRQYMREYRRRNSGQDSPTTQED